MRSAAASCVRSSEVVRPQLQYLDFYVARKSQKNVEIEKPRNLENGLRNYENVENDGWEWGATLPQRKSLDTGALMQPRVIFTISNIAWRRLTGSGV